jgi:hypothetical protein
MITNVVFWGPNEIVDGGMRISWSYNGVGFGQLDIVKDKEDKQLYINTEHMGKEFVYKVLTELINGAIDC